MSSAISQLSCFSSTNHELHLQTRPVSCAAIRSKVLVVISSGRSAAWMSGSHTKTISYILDASRSHFKKSAKFHATAEENVNGKGISEPAQDHVVDQQKRAAKIHDFCLGIPFGGLVLSGGLAGFIFTRNPATLSTGVLFGGALLTLSTISLKVWRQGKSSFPFILGQAVLAVALLWKNLQTYSMTKKMFPTGFYAVISAAMLCFYSYVVISGGNPPPKKLRSSAAAPS